MSGIFSAGVDESELCNTATTFRHIFTFTDVSRSMTNKSKKISVFISSTYYDLATHRKAVWERINETLPVEIRGMEFFGARSEKPIDVCLEEVAQSDIYVGIVGMRYGSVDKAKGRSFVELEYSKAVDSKLPILIYLIDENTATVHPKDVNRGANAILLNLFKQRLKENHKYELFTAEQDLSVNVASDVGRTLRKEGLIPESNSGDNIVASVNAGVITHGDRILFKGKTSGKSKSVGLWLFHDNYFLHRYIYVHPNGSFSDSLPKDVLNSLPEGQYFVLLQHPDDHNSFNVSPVHDSNTIRVVSTVNDTVLNLTGEDPLKGKDAAFAVISMLDNTKIGDFYVKLTFKLEMPWILVDTFRDISQGETISITGKTNYSPDTILSAEIMPVLSDGELQRENEGTLLFVRPVEIIEEEPYNRWTFKLDTDRMKEGRYKFIVRPISYSSAAVTVTADFSILKSV